MNNSNAQILPNNPAYSELKALQKQARKVEMELAKSGECTTCLSDLTAIKNQLNSLQEQYPKLNFTSLSNKIDRLTKDAKGEEIILGNTELVNDKTNEIEKDNNNATEKTGDIRKDYLNKVAWSNKMLDVNTMTEADLQTTFKYGEPIFGTIFTNDKIRTLQNSFSALLFELYVDGEIMPIFKKPYIYITTAMQENNYLQFALIPTQEWLDKNYAPYIKEDNRTAFNIAKHFTNVLKGKGDIHEVKLRMAFRAKPYELIDANFKIDASNTSDYYDKLANNLLALHTESVELPQAKMTDVTLSKKMVDIMNAKGSNQTFSKAIIVSSGWEIEKDKYTHAIIQRTLQAALVSKYSDGRCSFQYFLFGQDYAGGGKYSPTLKYVGAGKEKFINCSKL
ncbi:MAG: hypothetical protein H6553_06815 [Chitinophagales bacterium]|nr:hypothetical protein [Chitinophagales bacterium]